MKRKTTKEILAESYLELAERKSINRISVVDIVENCSMTKPTFYRYFKDKYINRVRPESNENKLILSLTPEGEQLKKLAIKVPSQMQGCIPLSEKDMILLRELLNRALAGMNIDRR